MTEVVEIGKVEDVDVGPIKLRVHTRASPYQEAQAVAILLKAGWNQTQIGKVLDLSQSNISKRLKLLDLAPENVDLLRSGKLKLTPAYYLMKGEKK